MTRHVASENGIALIVAMMAVLLMTALGVALVLTTSTESIIAGNFRNSREAMYAADAVLERAIDDLLTVADWDQVLNGVARSEFTDGVPSGPRWIAGDSKVDLTQAVNIANCQKITICSESDLHAVAAERPWGANNPRWQLYAYGNLADVLPAGSIHSSFYVVVLVGDDPSENDGNPLMDGASESNPGSGVLALRAEAFGPGAAHSRIEATIARSSSRGSGAAGVRMLSWREIR